MFVRKLYIVFIFFALQNFPSQFIRVNSASDAQSSYTPEELIKKVLVGCSAANISNVQISGQPANPSDKAYGYFNQNSTNFPFKEGIVISTGYAKSIGNTVYSGILDDNLGNGGDTDLSNAISTANLVDASYIEFDFVPVSDKISFNYIFASEEYNAQPCKYDDGFALLLQKYNTNGTTSAYINLAVLPNGDPVKVTKIHPSTNFAGATLPCAAINANYFGGYNTNPNSITNFDGYVVPLKAEANVIPNEKYHLKIIVADAANYRYDSGVFLEAGSFNSSVYITGDSNFCSGSFTTLTANTSSTAIYQWSKNGVPIFGETNKDLKVNSPGTYSVTITTSDNCGSTASVLVKEIFTSIAIYTPSQLNCTNSQTVLNASSSVIPAGSAILWTASNGGNIVSGANTLTPTVNAAGTYTLTVSGSCTISQSVTVSKDDTKPTVALTADKLKICKGDTVNLTASGAVSYSWNTSTSTGNTISVNPTATTTYTVSGTGTNGCTSNLQSITIQVLPDITSTLTDAKLCNGSATLDAGFVTGNSYKWFYNGNLISGQTQSTITATSTGQYTVEISNGICSKTFTANVLENKLAIATPQQLNCKVTQINLDASTSTLDNSFTILWTASNGGNIVSGANTLTPTINAAGTYTLTVSGSCTLSQSVTVTKDDTKPTVALTADKLKICKGDTVNLTASGAVSYTWNASTATANTISVNPTATTTYTVSGTGTNGCASNTQSITIQVLPDITSTLSDAKTCNGDYTTLDAGDNPDYTYSWFYNGTPISGIGHRISVNQIGIYKVVISNGICSKEFISNVTEPPLPKIENVDFQNNAITVSASGSGKLEYLLVGNNIAIGWQDSNVFNNIAVNTNYQIYVRLKGTSCDISTDFLTLSVPNFISPNGDGRNDVLDFSAISFYENFSFEIFDRFGKKVFSGNAQNPIWAGKYDGRNLPTGTYWYLMKWNSANGEKIKTGWIFLKTL